MRTTIEHIREKFADRQIIYSDDLYNLYQSQEPGIKKSTVNWRIYHLVQSGVLQRIGKGKFLLGPSNHYRPEISAKEIKINKAIKNEFPFIKYCIWNTSLLSEFLQHQLALQFIVVEVEKDVLESVFYSLKERFNQTFKKPTRQTMEEIIGSSNNTIIINPLISEAPIQLEKTIPATSLEKLLVDLHCDKTRFYFVQGYELLNIYRNAFGKYTINTSKLLRYARRRRKESQIRELIQSIV